MGLPTFLKFQRRQKVIKNILCTILDRVLLEAQHVGKLSKNLDISKAYDVIFPEFDHEDNQELGTAISYLMQGLSSAKSAGWISNETAMKILFKFCDLEIDINDELARIAADAQEKRPCTVMATDDQPGNTRGPDETEQPAESAMLRGKIKGNTIGGVGPGGW